MIFIKTLLLGIVAGVTAFFPVSSAGAVVLCSRLFSVQVDHRLFTAILLGIFLAMVLSMFQDLVRLGYSLGGIMRDLFYNMKAYLFSRGGQNEDYRRVLAGNYRNLLALLLLALVPAILLSILLGRAVQYAYGSFLTIGMGFFISAVILLVSSYMNVPEKGPRQMKPQEALILGCFQGVAFLPGISKIAAVSSAGFLCGISRRLSVIFAYLLGLVSFFMMLLPGRVHPAFAGIPGSGVLQCILGFAGAFGIGMTLIEKAQRLLSKETNRIFAGANVVLGMAALLIHLLAR
ncbi:MAG: undecaprenyl-diphosphate phosphatase [Eubacterium sp.]|nr:undecaprenyl-diphosphate phosphatase [Eubacterium sp.]